MRSAGWSGLVGAKRKQKKEFDFPSTRGDWRLVWFGRSPFAWLEPPFLLTSLQPQNPNPATRVS